MRKKKRISTILAIILFLAVIGTISARGNNDQSMSRQPSDGMNTSVPDWFYNLPEDPDYIYGIGYAKMENPEKSRQVAELRARTELVFQINTYVRPMEVSYIVEAGTTNDMAVLELIGTINHVWASASLKWSEIVEYFVAPDETHWALVRYPKNSTRAYEIDRINTARKVLDETFEQFGTFIFFEGE